MMHHQAEYAIKSCAIYREQHGNESLLHLLSGMYNVYAMLACEQSSLLQLQTRHTIRQRHVCATFVWWKIIDVFLLVASITVFYVSMPSLQAHCTCVLSQKYICQQYDQSISVGAMQHQVKQVPGGSNSKADHRF